MEPTPPPPLRFLVVDDHPFFREGLTTWIERQQGWSCCGVAENIRGALTQLQETAPDVVLLDLNLKGEDGLSLLSASGDAKRNASFIVLTQSEDVVHAERALRAGAKGFVMKEEATSTLLQAVQLALRNEVYVSARLTAHMVRRFAHSTSTGSDPLKTLSARELQVLALLGNGNTSKEIADQLGISPKTAEAHRDNLRRKLKFPDATTLLRNATIWRHEGRI